MQEIHTAEVSDRWTTVFDYISVHVTVMVKNDYEKKPKKKPQLPIAYTVAPHCKSTAGFLPGVTGDVSMLSLGPW